MPIDRDLTLKQMRLAIWMRNSREIIPGYPTAETASQG
jgi:hypothetical protein